MTTPEETFAKILLGLSEGKSADELMKVINSDAEKYATEHRNDH